MKGGALAIWVITTEVAWFFLLPILPILPYLILNPIVYGTLRPIILLALLTIAGGLVMPALVIRHDLKNGKVETTVPRKIIGLLKRRSGRLILLSVMIVGFLLIFDTFRPILGIWLYVHMHVHFLAMYLYFFYIFLGVIIPMLTIWSYLLLKRTSKFEPLS